MSSSCLKSIFSSKKNSFGEFFFENTNFEFDSRAELPRRSCQMLDPKKVTKKSDLERSEMFQFWQHRLQSPIHRLFLNGKVSFVHINHYFLMRPKSGNLKFWKTVFFATLLLLLLPEFKWIPFEGEGL